MSQSADVDKMVSSFLSELNGLCDSLELTPDKAAFHLPASNEQRNFAGYERIPATNAGSRPATQDDFGTENSKNGGLISQTALKSMPCRNINVLLMNDKRFIPGTRQNTEEFHLTSNVPEEAPSPGIPYLGQPRLTGWAWFRSFHSLCWAPFAAWIRKFRGRGHSVQPSKPGT
jgi:hypothetical protein